MDSEKNRTMNNTKTTFKEKFVSLLTTVIPFSYSYYKKNIECRLWNIIHLIRIHQIKRKKKCKVAFYAMNLTYWNYQHLYDLLKKDSRFSLYVILSPSLTSPIELRNEDAKALRFYFSQHSVDYIDCNAKGEVSIDVRNDINPDIIFYSQPTTVAIASKDYCKRFKDKLICYYPYAFWTANGKWSYNKDLHRLAWKCFYSTPLHLEDAKNLCDTKGRNVVITGYPKTDDYLTGNFKDVWKIKDKKHKRLIWAPHFTLKPSVQGTVARSNFLMMADFMVEIAKKYSDRLQIAFKPHPRLKSELYIHPEWGKEKTDKYYALWDSMPNTFVDTEEYIDLFMTSDAMVHDCSSFSVEYHYSQNPVMFVCQDLEAYKCMLNNFGKKALDMHYIGKTEQDIISFIEEKVLMGNDPMKPQRDVFYKQYLVPSHKMSVAEYTYHHIVTSLGWEDIK